MSNARQRGHLCHADELQQWWVAPVCNGYLSRTGCCCHPLMQAGCRAVLATGAGQGCWSGSSCVRAWGRGQRYCPSVPKKGVAAPLSAASHGVGSAQGTGVQQGSQGAGTLGLRDAFQSHSQSGAPALCYNVNGIVGTKPCLRGHTGSLSSLPAAGTWTSTGLGLCPTPRLCGKSRSGTAQGMQGGGAQHKP